MKALNLVLGILMAIVVGQKAHADRIDTNVAFDLFVSQGVHSTLRQSCAHCHGDKMTGDILGAPQHSAEDPKMAFSVFLKKMNNFESPMDSTFLKYANTKHFCTRYDYNCGKADVILKELNEKILIYAKSVKEQSTHSSGANAALVDAKDFSQVIEGKKKMTVISSAEVVSIRDSQVQLNFKLPYTSSVTIPFFMNLSLVFNEVSPGYFKLDGSWAVADKGIFKVKGMYFAINGVPYGNKTGFERINRGIQFIPKAKAIGFLDSVSNAVGLGTRKETENNYIYIMLSDVKPIFNLRDGDTVQVAFEEFNEVKKFPSRYCDTLDKRNLKDLAISAISAIQEDTRTYCSQGSCALAAVINQELRSQEQSYLSGQELYDIEGQYENFQRLSDEEGLAANICYELESRVDFGDVRRSIFFAELFREGRERRTDEELIMYVNKEVGEIQASIKGK